jgi:hypothetical protein
MARAKFGILEMRIDDTYLAELRGRTPKRYLSIIDVVWAHPEDFLRWPQRAFLFSPGTVRDPYHKYSSDQLAQIKAAKVAQDTRSNGPAIMAFAIAGGERPKRAAGNKQWTIHHIYDGKHPFPSQQCSHAVKSGHLFSEAAGLVAAHPIADALADEFAFFAWLLRREAFIRFAFDPDHVFSNGAI